METEKRYGLAAAEQRPGERTIVDVGGRRIGGDGFATIAGPCAVESREVMLESARAVRDAGAQLLRGGAWPRTSPYSYQGLGEAGLRLLAEDQGGRACRWSRSSWTYATSPPWLRWRT